MVTTAGFCGHQERGLDSPKVTPKSQRERKNKCPVVYMCPIKAFFFTTVETGDIQLSLEKGQGVLPYPYHLRVATVKLLSLSLPLSLSLFLSNPGRLGLTS